MKAVLAASVCSIISTSAALSASVTLAGNSTSVAATTAALLLDAGVSPKDAGGGVFVVEAKNFHCDQHSNAAVDSSNAHAALPSIKCRINSRNKRGAQSGQAFGEGRAMAEVLQKAQADGVVEFTDCAMGGYCGIFAKTIKCTVDTKIDDVGDGRRWSCILDDGQ
jgi:hypothetical protein